MMDYRNLEQCLSDALHLLRRPVAMTFRETPPAGVLQFTGVEPSGCSSRTGILSAPVSIVQ